MSPVRVVVVDDHPVFRMGMGALLATLDGIEVVGEAASAPRRWRSPPPSGPTWC